MSYQCLEPTEPSAGFHLIDRSAPDACSPAPVAPDIELHPVFAALNEPTRRRLLETGRTERLSSGDSWAAVGRLAFVQRGMLGTLATDDKVCVALAGSGSLLGLDTAFNVFPARANVALAATQLFAAPAAVLVETLGRTKVMELCMRHTLARLASLESEAACNAAHMVPQRLAKWLLRLHRAGQGHDVLLTQVELAQLMGVQRTSISSSARQHLFGAVRFTRGRIVIKDGDLLARTACGCEV